MRRLKGREHGFPAVLVRLPTVTRAQLHKLIVDAWRRAPRQLVKDGVAAARPSERRSRRESNHERGELTGFPRPTNPMPAFVRSTYSRA
jgi:hypothetical protein